MIMSMHKLSIAVLFVVMGMGAPAQAQVMSPSLERHQLEVGYIYKWNERDFDSSFMGQEDWSLGTAYLRYGVCRWATISIEGAIANVDHEGFGDSDYRRYTIGFGLTVPCYRSADWQVDVAGHYCEIFDHDRSANEMQKNVRDFAFAVQVERFFTVRDQSVAVWGGPAFVYDQSRQYPAGTYIPIENDTSHNVGFVLGVNAVLFKRANVFSHVLYADTFQPRVGLGAQF
jgi:hypothetical protein